MNDDILVCSIFLALKVICNENLTCSYIGGEISDSNKRWHLKFSAGTSSLATTGILSFCSLFSGSIITKRHRLNRSLAYAYKYTVSRIVCDLFQ